MKCRKTFSSGYFPSRFNFRNSSETGNLESSSISTTGSGPGPVPDCDPLARFSYCVHGLVKSGDPLLIEIVPGIGDEDLSESEDDAVNLILDAGRGGKFGYGESVTI